MFKKTVSIFLTILFLGIISAPSIIVSIDDSIDISVLYNISEEEEETNNLKLVVSEIDDDTDSYPITFKNQSLGFYFKKHPKPHVNLISPPPEFNKG
ncbi:hypothetical protein [Lutibacter flavus]|uniref:Uncharacterized protein n=1 Tax=Lutibacter flavus TaxID=691689 RepID=A0A238X3U6_9FLAO|nr:hypothetical protein [Lutibacter flavus]SNR53044.1 hypothetical protein SAMN04488111_1505 [Lutibacter flavus]